MKTETMKIRIPALPARIISVWARHMSVYTRNLFSNAFPPFLEPLIFLAGIGLGVGMFIRGNVDGMPYLLFLATGLIITPAMYTASFECSYGTFVRLEYDHVYDGMLAAPLTYRDVIWGELLFVGTKGVFFSLSVLIIVFSIGIVRNPFSLVTPFVGGLTGLMFGAIALVITSFVNNLNYFNFFFTGFLSPMFFFSGLVFPLSNLPKPLQFVAEILPLTHPIRMARSLCTGRLDGTIVFDFFYCLLFIVVFGYLATKLLKKRLIF
jgi:lipooligosaccharide transport system permease protein